HWPLARLHIMARPESEEYIDTLSSGDGNNMGLQTQKEVNNNEIDELSKELSEMGCVVDAMKRPPNICVESCVYESDSENAHDDDPNEDAYSDEFEEEDEESIATEEKSSKTDSRESRPNTSAVKLSKSRSSVSSNKPPSFSGRSGMSTDYGHNHILLTKILSARNTRKSSIPSKEPLPRRPLPSAAVLRKNHQRQIDHDNL
ncbi:putative glutamic acid-rich protein, partial [Operophtera brumata]